jgi:ribonucleotide reductase beta subunit family protein with ferritin-like domain
MRSICLQSINAFNLFQCAKLEMRYVITAPREQAMTSAISRREAKHMQVIQITEQIGPKIRTSKIMRKWVKYNECCYGVLVEIT